MGVGNAKIGIAHSETRALWCRPEVQKKCNDVGCSERWENLTIAERCGRHNYMYSRNNNFRRRGLRQQQLIYIAIYIAGKATRGLDCECIAELNWDP